MNGDNIGLRFIFDFRKPILITHGDADGLTSAALIIREFERAGIPVPLFITQPFSLHNVLKDIKAKEMDGNLIIVDLELSEKSIKELPNGSVIIDHHPRTEAMKPELDELDAHYLINTERSASQLVGPLVSRNKFNGYLVRLGAVGDWKIYDKKLGIESVKMAAAMSFEYKNDEFRSEIVGELVKGNKIKDMEFLNKKANEAFKRLDRIKKNGRKCFEGKNIVANFYNEAIGFSSALANKLMNKKDKISFVFTEMEGNGEECLITARCPKNKYDVNLGKFLNGVSSLNVEGGGLSRAASGVIEKKDLNKFLGEIEELDKNLSESD